MRLNNNLAVRKLKTTALALYLYLAFFLDNRFDYVCMINNFIH